VIASAIAFLTDGFFHERIVPADWTDVYRNLGITRAPSQRCGLALLRHFRTGPWLCRDVPLRDDAASPSSQAGKPALAGLVTWLAFSVTGPAQFIPLGFFSNALWLKVGAFHLVTSITATIAGAAIYKEGQ